MISSAALVAVRRVMRGNSANSYESQESLPFTIFCHPGCHPKAKLMDRLLVK